MFGVGVEGVACLALQRNSFPSETFRQHASGWESTYWELGTVKGISCPLQLLVLMMAPLNEAPVSS